MKEGQLVRFVTNARGQEWAKGTFGVVSKVLSYKPLAQDDIYLVANHEVEVWCTGAEIEPWYQLTLFPTSENGALLPLYAPTVSA